ARQNHFEWMFNPLANAGYVKANEAAFVSDADIVMAVDSNGEAAAYPIRQMAYHHLDQDTVGGTPIVATYSTLCHTGLVWETTVNGRQLHFHLAGINNQNFIMRDEETGSWWQQITGEAIQGPLKGKKLKAVYSDELTFVVWKQEQPAGRVLQPDPRIASTGGYDPWEKDVAKMPVRVDVAPDKRLEPRALVIGLTVNDKVK